MACYERLEPRELLAADPLYRVNAGGEELAATPLAWAEDTNASGSTFSNYSPGAITSSTYGTVAPINLTHGSIPVGVPEEVFQTQRFDKPNQPNLEWDFPVAPGEYEVRLYFAEIWSGAFAEGVREFDVEIEGVKVLDDYDVFAEAGAQAGIVETFFVTSDETLDLDFLRNPGKNDPAVMGIEILPVEAAGSTASSSFAAAPGGLIEGSSTYKSGSFVIENTSSAGEKIESVTIDLSTGFLPDIVFDPNGGAGDGVAKPFTADSGAAETGQSGVSYLGEHDGGFDALEILFADFDPGEVFSFSIDVDPTSIQGTSQPGPGQSGSVSGLEVAGATVTVSYSDGSSRSGRLFPEDGSETDAQVRLANTTAAAVAIELLDAPVEPTILDTASQTLRVSGAPGATVRVIQVESGLFLGASPFDVDPYETNKALAVSHMTETIGPGGFVDIEVTLFDSETEGGVNHFFAAVEDASGNTGALSNLITVALQDLPPGSDLGVVDEGPITSEVVIGPSVTATAPVTVTAQVVDASSEIVAVEGFLNAVGAEGSGVPLSAADGSFDSAVETAIGVINTQLFNTIPIGTHTIFLRAQNTAGVWGDVASATLTRLAAETLDLSALTLRQGSNSSGEELGDSTSGGQTVPEDDSVALALLIPDTVVAPESQSDLDEAFAEYQNPQGEEPTEDESVELLAL